MTLADVSDVVRDALAIRRSHRRRLGATHWDVPSTLSRARWHAGFGDAWTARVLGLPAYVPDPPVPLL